MARDARGARRRAHDQVGIADRLDLKAEPREGEGVAGGQRAREIFLDPAQSPPVSEAYVGHRCLHDDSGIEPVLRRALRVRNAPAAMPFGAPPPAALIAFAPLPAARPQTHPPPTASPLHPPLRPSG